MQSNTQEKEALRYPLTTAKLLAGSVACGITGLALQTVLPDSMASVGPSISNVLYFLSGSLGLACWSLCKVEPYLPDNSLSTLTSKPLTEVVLDSSVTQEQSDITLVYDPKRVTASEVRSHQVRDETDPVQLQTYKDSLLAQRAFMLDHGMQWDTSKANAEYERILQEERNQNKKINIHPAPELLSAKTFSRPSVSVCPYRLVAYSAQNSTCNSQLSSKRGKKFRSGSMETAPGLRGECKGCALSSSCTLEKSISSTAPVIQKITVKRKSRNG